MQKKKIIHIIQSLDNGGCENMLFRTLPLLTDFNHVIITLKRDGELAEKFKEKNITIFNLKQKGLFDIFSYISLIRILIINQPKLIITYLFHADMIGRLIIQQFVKTPVIPFLRTTYNHEKYKLARIAEKLTKFLVKKYLANSESVKSFYVKEIGVPEKKITVIPNGIDVDFYNKIPRDENLKISLDIKPEDTVIICVANLHINKGHKYLLEAFENIYEENKHIKLLIVGGGEEKENLLKQAKIYQSKNNILFLGRRNDVPKLLKISDIFVLPTLFEGMSNAIMEAMASGLAIITTDIPENKQLIKNKENGLLISTRNYKNIITNLKNLINNKSLRLALGNNAKDSIYENFSMEKIKSNWTSSLK